MRRDAVLRDVAVSMKLWLLELTTCSRQYELLQLDNMESGVRVRVDDSKNGGRKSAVFRVPARPFHLA